MLGLPDGVTACLFDMDGVVTRTAVVHDAAWKEMFDDFLRQWSAQTGKEFVPFDLVQDYDEYVDGKPRLEGTSSFLESRGISLPTGSVSDPPGTHTAYGLSNRKNDLVLAVLERDGVEVYQGSSRYIAAARAAGLRTAIVSSSANTAAVLEAGGVLDLFDAQVEASRMLGAESRAAAVFEDALAGVAAGRAGAFRFVVGVDRVGQAAELRAHG